MIVFGNSDHMGSHKSIPNKKTMVLTKVNDPHNPWRITIDNKLVKICRNWQEVQMVFREAALSGLPYTWYIERK